MHGTREEIDLVYKGWGEGVFQGGPLAQLGVMIKRNHDIHTKSWRNKAVQAQEAAQAETLEAHLGEEKTNSTSTFIKLVLGYRHEGQELISRLTVTSHPPILGLHSILELEMTLEIMI